MDATDGMQLLVIIYYIIKQKITMIILDKIKTFFLKYVKVRKSQKKFFLKFNCQKSKQKFWQIFALTSKMGQINSILLHSGLNPTWHFWLSTRFSYCLKMKSVENILGYIAEQSLKLFKKIPYNVQVLSPSQFLKLKLN